MATPKDVLRSMKKPLLYVALYALDGALSEHKSSGSHDASDQHKSSFPEDYHWTFIIAPKDEQDRRDCIRYRMIKESVKGEDKIRGKVEFEKLQWEHDKRLVPPSRHDDIVVRVLVGKIVHPNAVEAHMELDWPDKTAHVKDSGRARTSKDWVQRVVESMSSADREILMSGKLAEWKTIESVCTSFAKRAMERNTSLGTVPTFDMLQNKEVS